MTSAHLLEGDCQGFLYLASEGKGKDVCLGCPVTWSIAYQYHVICPTVYNTTSQLDGSRF